MKNLDTKINILNHKIARINRYSLKSMEKYITDHRNPKYFFSMTSINKLGVNPHTEFNTVAGAYAYPLDKQHYTYLINDKLPWAGDQPYIKVFSLAVPTFNLLNYTEDQLIQAKNKILDAKLCTQEDILKWSQQSRTDFPFGRLFNITRMIAKKNISKWNAALRWLGFTHIYDPGAEVIHQNEPTQLVVLDPRIIKEEDTFYNPLMITNDQDHIKEDSIVADKIKSDHKNENIAEYIHNLDKDKITPRQQKILDKLFFKLLSEDKDHLIFRMIRKQIPTDEAFAEGIIYAKYPVPYINDLAHNDKINKHKIGLEIVDNLKYFTDSSLIDDIVYHLIKYFDFNQSEKLQLADKVLSLYPDVAEDIVGRISQYIPADQLISILDSHHLVNKDTIERLLSNSSMDNEEIASYLDKYPYIKKFVIENYT